MGKKRDDSNGDECLLREVGPGKIKMPLPHTRTTHEIWEKIKPLAREMRKAPTPAEEALWQQIRGKRLLGCRFRRQHPIDRFIADFYCAEARLVIEVDGAIHDYTPEEDAARQAFLESLGLRVLRFSNGDVLTYLNGVLERIGEVLQEQTSSPPGSNASSPPGPLSTA